jgi:serine/threonine protein kinase
VELQQNAAHLERFLMEEWIAKRINNSYVLKAAFPNRKRHYFYTVAEYVDGQTLSQWMIDNPKPSLETVRALVEQIAKGLQAFHRLEMVHQDIRPENIMVDNTGTVTLIDFGSTKVAGIAEIDSPLDHHNLLGTIQYMAPEYFIGEGGNQRGDIFSLAVITYQMLTGRLPYGTEVAKTKTRSQQYKLSYKSALLYNRDIPLWVDGALRKALQPDPYKRYGEVTEFIYELRHPNEEFLRRSKPPLLERDPVLFWKSVALIMTALTFLLAAKLLRA